MWVFVSSNMESMRNTMHKEIVHLTEPRQGYPQLHRTKKHFTVLQQVKEKKNVIYLRNLILYFNQLSPFTKSTHFIMCNGGFIQHLWFTQPG